MLTEDEAIMALSIETNQKIGADKDDEEAAKDKPATADNKKVLAQQQTATQSPNPENKTKEADANKDPNLVEVTVQSSIDLSSIMPDGVDPGEVKVLTSKATAEALTQSDKKEPEQKPA